MKTVLIFAHECAPYHRPQSTIGAQRPAQFAKYLPEFGWRSVVLCCDNERRNVPAVDGEQLRQEVAARLAAAGPSDPVIIPTPSLAWDGCIDHYWRDNVQTRGRPQLAWRKLLTSAKYFSGDWSQSWQPCARVAAQAVAAQTPVDACLGESGPDAGMFLGRWFADTYRVPWVMDFRDPLLRGINRWGRYVYGRVARRLLATAGNLINVTPVWAEMDEKLFRRPAVCIPNGFDPAEFSSLPELGPREGRSFKVAFAGSIRDTLEIFLAGLAQLAQPAERITFAYWGTAAERVATLAKKYGVAHLVEIHGHIAREQALAHLRRADLLLLLNLPNVPKKDIYVAQGVYPGKAFEYFGLAKPILCVPGDGSLLDALLRETHTGTVANTPQEVADYLTEALCARHAGREIEYTPENQVIARYTRSNLARQLAQVLDKSQG